LFRPQVGLIVAGVPARPVVRGLGCTQRSKKNFKKGSTRQGFVVAEPQPWGAGLLAFVI
jgi:hypothetical protein